jgi:hypothetical protein
VSALLSARVPEGEMVGVHATPDVAAVAEDHAGGNRPVLQRPGEPVRLLVPALVAEGAVAVHECARQMWQPVSGSGLL